MVREQLERDAVRERREQLVARVHDREDVVGRGGSRSIGRADGDGGRARSRVRRRAARRRGRATAPGGATTIVSVPGPVQKNSSCAHSSSSCAPPSPCAASIIFARPNQAVPRLGPPPTMSIFVSSGSSRPSRSATGSASSSVRAVASACAVDRVEARVAARQLGRPDGERVQRPERGDVRDRPRPEPGVVVAVRQGHLGRVGEPAGGVEGDADRQEPALTRVSGRLDRADDLPRVRDADDPRACRRERDVVARELERRQGLRRDAAPAPRTRASWRARRSGSRRSR